MPRRPDPPLTPRAVLRWSIVGRTVADLRPRTVLELGCGLGAVGVRLARLAAYTAAEPDDVSVGVARRRLAPAGGAVIHGDHRAVPAGSRYDLVCAFEVLEHIADDAGALAAWLSLVRPGGHLLLSVPANPDSYGPWDEVVGHHRRYSADQLRQLMTGAGAVDVTVRHYGWPLGTVLDAVRELLFPAGRAGRAAAPPRDEDTARHRTHGSGRVLQPTSATQGLLIRAAVAPFSAAQRLRPRHGPGLIALATRPPA